MDIDNSCGMPTSPTLTSAAPVSIQASTQDKLVSTDASKSAASAFKVAYKSASSASSSLRKAQPRPRQYTLDDTRRKLYLELLTGHSWDGMTASALSLRNSRARRSRMPKHTSDCPAAPSTLSSSNLLLSHVSPFSSPAPVAPSPHACPAARSSPTSPPSASKALMSSSPHVCKAPSPVATMMQLHTAGRDICLLPSAFSVPSSRGSSNALTKTQLATSRAISSTSTSIRVFAALLGSELESSASPPVSPSTPTQTCTG
ncbi:hypothetical protein V8E36_002911 [Tilletia maclaganii]